KSKQASTTGSSSMSCSQSVASGGGSRRIASRPIIASATRFMGSSSTPTRMPPPRRGGAVSQLAGLTYIHGLPDGFPAPGNPGALPAYIAGPDPDPPDGPVAWIWPAPGDEKRRALPRNLNGQPGTAGWKDSAQVIHIYLLYFLADEEPDADNALP